MWGKICATIYSLLPTYSGAEIAKHILFKQRKLILLSDLFKHYCFTKGPEKASKEKKGTFS